jgi:hypothetical protein
VLTLALALLYESADAQIDNRCLEAASLWIPPDTSREITVVKWTKPIKFGIAPDNDELTRSVEATLQFLARESGLRIETNLQSALDLMIAVPPDISVVVLGARDYVEGYFEDFYRKNGISTRFELDRVTWENNYRVISPKCLGTNLVIGGVVERAFVLIQQGESSLCTYVGLAKIFGLVNIRKYYFSHDRDVPIQLIGSALRTLYDKRIKAGMNAIDARKALRDVCKTS